MGGAGNGRCGAVRGGRATRTWDGGGARGGAQGSRSGRSGAHGGRGCASGIKSGAGERLRRGGAVGSVRAGGGCAAWGASGSAAVCGTGPRRGASRASQEAWAVPGWPRAVRPGTRKGGGESPPPSMDLPRSWYGSSGCPRWGSARGGPSAWTWWLGGYGSWYGGGGPRR